MNRPTHETGISGLTKSRADRGTELALGLGLSYQTGGAFRARVEVDAYDMLDGVWAGFLTATYQFK